MYIRLFCFLFFVFAAAAVRAQDSLELKQDSAPVKRAVRIVKPVIPDSAALARLHISDSLALAFIAKPDSLRKNMFVEQILHDIKNRKYVFFDDLDSNKSKTFRQIGTIKATRDPWVMGIVLALLVYSAVLVRMLNKEVVEILQSVYSKRVFMQLSKEDKFLNPRSFLLLFCLFGATLGLFLYQLAGYYGATYTLSGFQLFLAFSLIVLLLFTLKILILRVLGFIFGVQKLAKAYLSILYLAYFNVAFIFLIIVICFSMLSSPLVPLLLFIATVLVILIFVFQYLRSSINVISGFRLHKVYLIIYLCALEICPILILIKALKL